jgi:anaerobic magnesium-protoporphyrin IX monomethyl ester cyclase
MKVALVRPPLLFPRSRPIETLKVAPPLGMAYVAGSLRSAGHQVDCVDAMGEALHRYRECAYDKTLNERGLGIEEIVGRISESAEIIGITSMFSFEWFYVIHLIRAIRKKFPDKMIVVGGEHATSDYEFILKSMPEVDVCVLGEGENKILGLVHALENGAVKSELPGVAYLDSQTQIVHKNPETDGQYRIRDINAIPRPAWDLLPITKYLDLEHLGPGVRPMPMQGTRGCPHQCTFCSSPQMWTTRWKPRDVNDLIDEIKTYVREYQITRLEFCDLTLVVDEKWTKEFCQGLIDANLGITWSMPTGSRTEALTPEVLKLLKKSGCHRLTYPFETGSPKTSALIKKKINYKQSLASLRNAVKTGMTVKVTIVTGFPFQNVWDVMVELLFAVRLAWIGTADVTFFNFVPYPGSELHEQMVAQGKIIKDDTYPAWLSKVFLANYADSQSWCPQISVGKLKLLCIMGMAIFYGCQFLFRPHRAVLLVYRVLANKPLTLLEFWFATLFQRLTRRRPRYFLDEQHA